MKVRDVFSLTVTKWISLIATIVYSICQIQYFGTSMEIEAFLAGTMLFGMIISLSQSGQLSEIFLPEYVRLKNEHGDRAAHDAFSVVLNWLLLFVCGSSVMFFLAATPIIAFCYPGFEAAAKINATIVFRIVCVLLAVEVSGALIKTVLNAEEIYGRPEIIGAIASILGVVVIAATAEGIGIWSLILAFTIGKLIAFGYYVYCLKNINFKYRLKWESDHFDKSSFFKTAFSSIAYAFATQFYSLVLNAALSRLPQGYFAIYRYVINLYTKLRGSVTQPMITVFFTQFSNDFSKKNQLETSRTNTRNAVAYCLAAIGFVWICIFAYGETGLQILWGSKKFSATDIHFAWIVLVWAALGLVVGGVGGVFRKIAVAIGKAKSAYFYWMISQLITAGAVYLLTEWLGIESLKYLLLVNIVLLSIPSWAIVYSFDRQLGFPFEKSLLRTAITLICVLPIAILMANIYPNSEFLNSSRIAGLGFLLTSGSLTFFVFLSMAWIMDVPGVRDISFRVRRRLTRTSNATTT